MCGFFSNFAPANRTFPLPPGIMKRTRRYKITIEDESHLTEVASVSVSPLGFWSSLALIVVLSLFFSGLIIWITPLRTLLPGYLKQSQRSATEEGLLRLDSMMTLYEQNRMFVDNFLRVTDTDRVPGDSSAVVPVSRELSSDSLMTAGRAEQQFVERMEERERYNISVLAPLAADGVNFSPVTADGIFTSDSRRSETGVVVLPGDESIQCAADGSVIALYYSAPEHGYVIAVQHAKGFVTSYAGMGTPLVGMGDYVNSGQIIALAPKPDKNNRRSFRVRMWHNGLALVPYDYLAGK